MQWVPELCHPFRAGLAQHGEPSQADEPVPFSPSVTRDHEDVLRPAYLPASIGALVPQSRDLVLPEFSVTPPVGDLVPKTDMRLPSRIL